MCLRIWQNTLSVQIKDIICMMQADHPFKVNGWSVSFLELAFYFGCPGVNAFGGFVTFVHFVEGKSYRMHRLPRRWKRRRNTRPC